MDGKAAQTACGADSRIKFQPDYLPCLVRLAHIVCVYLKQLHTKDHRLCKADEYKVPWIACCYYE